MKKILILLLMVLSIGIIFINAKAIDIETYKGQEYNIATNWTTFQSPEGDHTYYYQFDVTIKELTDYDYIYFLIDFNNINSIYEAHFNDIYMDMQDTSTHYIPLIPLMGAEYTTNFVLWNNILEVKNTLYSSYNYNEDTITGIYEFDYNLTTLDYNRISIIFESKYNDVIEPPTNLLSNLQNSFSFAGLDDLDVVLFIDGGEVYKTTFYDSNSLPPEPVTIPTREGYLFVGWRTITGVYYDFESPVKLEYINFSGYFTLYSTYVEADTYSGVSVPINISLVYDPINPVNVA